MKCLISIIDNLSNKISFQMNVFQIYIAFRVTVLINGTTLI